MRTLMAFLVASLLAAPAGAGYSFDTAPMHPDFEPGVEAVRTRDWPTAIEHLERVVAQEPANADAHTWLGHALRRHGDLARALRHYQAALRVDRSHRIAHQNIGEAYLEAGDKAKARKHLAALERLCARDCEEYRALARAVAAAR